MPTTTSASLSNKPRPVLLLLIAACLAAVGGCSDPGDEPCEGQECGPDCFNADSPEIEGPPATAFHRGRITLESVVSFSSTGAQTSTNEARASYTDISQVLVSSRKPSLVQSSGCYGLTGGTTTVCRPGFNEPCTKEYLAVEKVEITGTGGGALTLDELGKGILAKGSLPDPLYAVDDLQAKVTAGAAEGSFMSYEQALTSPDLLKLSLPDPAGKPLGSADLKFQWEPGNGDYVVINISHMDDKTTDKIQCVVLDDGCHTVFVGDLEFYDFTPGNPFKVTMIREKTTVKTIDEKTAAEFTAASRVEMVLTR